MPKSPIIYQAEQEIAGKHMRAKIWINYSGKLTVYDKKNHPVTLEIKSEILDSIQAEIMDDAKIFKGSSVTEVYAKLSKWLYLREVIFQC